MLFLSGVSIDDPADRLAALDAHGEQSREVALAAILASIEAGDVAGAHRRINARHTCPAVPRVPFPRCR